MIRIEMIRIEMIRTEKTRTEKTNRIKTTNPKIDPCIFNTGVVLYYSIISPFKMEEEMML